MEFRNPRGAVFWKLLCSSPIDLQGVYFLNTPISLHRFTPALSAPCKASGEAMLLLLHLPSTFSPSNSLEGSI